MTTSPGIPPPPLRLGDAGAAGGGLRASRQPAVETASPLARLDVDCTWLALSVTRAATGRSFRERGERLPLKPSACSLRQSGQLRQASNGISLPVGGPLEIRRSIASRTAASFRSRSRRIALIRACIPVICYPST